MSCKVLVIGAGEAARLVVREIREHPALDREVVGLLDDNPALHGTAIDGIEVLGSSADLVNLAAGCDAREIIIAVPSASGPQARELVQRARQTRLPVRIVPGIRDIIKGTVHWNQVREVVPEDLLGRETVDLAESSIRDAVQGRRVLVTGAGGSIGSEICRQLVNFSPDRIYMLGRGENSIFEIAEELRDGLGYDRAVPVLADVRDGVRMSHLATQFPVDVVLHAAAHKHVPLMEDYPEEAVMVNVVGTANVIEFAKAAGADRFVMLSTDKAVRPRSVMGATKRIAELLVQSAAAGGALRYMAVRFGNVLGSRGSVVTVFQRQLKRGGPLTVTDREATRYFMTIREAAMLVVQGMAEGKGGEVFVLDMGEAIRIEELARNLITMAQPDNTAPIEIVETGLRPGEKLREQYLAETDPTQPGPHPQILVARPTRPAGFDPGAVVRELSELAERCDRDAIRARIVELLPDHEAHVD
ncbi:polysaccharide biosynthesis protein [bacterium]|nr:MAG: polysaccharide biosynthesis protein [bacterium]